MFLDEIVELHVSLQDRLLRTLEEYSIPRFGIGNETPVHCRVIASSKSRLEDYVSAGLFREDLLARLAVLRIELPPLREREDDARLIADHLLADASRLQGIPRRQLGLDAIPLMRSHRWPGNVRELKHVIERAMVVSDSPLIGAEHLVINQRRTGAGAVRGATTFGEIRIPADGKRLRDIEREALELTLQLTDFNQSAAARILCISRPTLARKLRTYGLEKHGERGQIESRPSSNRPSALLHGRSQECQRSIPSQLRRFCVVDGRALVIEERVVGVVEIRVDLFSRVANPLNEPVGDVRRRRLVVRGEVREHRTGETRNVGLHGRVNAVEVDGGADALGVVRRGEERELPAHAEPDCCDLLGRDPVEPDQVVGCSTHVFRRFGDVEGHHQLASVIGALRLLPMIQVGRECYEALGVESIGEVGDVSDQSPPFLHDDDARSAP